MTLIDLQRRLKEIGRIRIGQQAVNQQGKSHPVKLETFRLTSPDERRIQQAAGMFGGRPELWADAPPPMRQWQVVTETDQLDVVVPPGDMAFSQNYETWSRGGCSKRCDGRWDVVNDLACSCDPQARECDIHTRLSVMLRDLPGLGVWRLDTQGYYAAVELGGAVDVCTAAVARGQMLPARLRLEQRQVKRPGQGARKFAVPVLDVDVTIGALLAGAGAPQMLAVPPGSAGELGQGRAANLTPVPASLSSGPTVSVRDQVTAVGDDARPARSNGQAPVPATGLKPRTAEQATVTEAVPTVDVAAVEALLSSCEEAGVDVDRAQVLSYAVRSEANRDAALERLAGLLEKADEKPVNDVQPTTGYDRRPATAAQQKKVVTATAKAGLDDDARHGIISCITGGRTDSSKELVRGDVDRVLEAVEEIRTGGHVLVWRDKSFRILKPSECDPDEVRAGAM